MHLGYVPTNGSGGGSQLCTLTTRILGELFSRTDIVKVGWDFGGRDIEKLQQSGGRTGK